MPAVKKLFQESENQKKHEYIFGHMFGRIGVLIGGTAKWFCLPLHINLQDGMDTMLSWNKENKDARTHVVQMIENAYEATAAFGKFILLLDRYFLSVPALEALKQCNDKAGRSCIWLQKQIGHVQLMNFQDRRIRGVEGLLKRENQLK